MARKQLNVFSLSFLDAMTCGFGAVILFFMIINANIDLRREADITELASEADRMELQVLVGRKNLLQIQQELADLIEEWAILRGLKEEIVTEINLTAEEFSELTADTTAQEEAIERLRSELDALEDETQRLSAESITPEDAGDRIRSVQGDGNRQYLTGLRMGGERVVILVDASEKHATGSAVGITQVAAGREHCRLVDCTAYSRHTVPDFCV